MLMELQAVIDSKKNDIKFKIRQQKKGKSLTLKSKFTLQEKG